MQSGKFSCEDVLKGVAGRKVERFIHFAPDVVLQQTAGQTFDIRLHQHRFELTMDQETEAAVLQGRVSAGYGQMQEAPILRLLSRPAGDTRLFFRIKSV
jgi:hypothetical protein